MWDGISEYQMLLKIFGSSKKKKKKRKKQKTETLY